MSLVNIRNVEFVNNPARFTDPYIFRVTFECIAPLKHDLEWKLIYVSSPDHQELDQELDDCMVGPVPVGVNSFEFEGSPPDPKLIPPQDVLGVAAIILTASYRDQEFVRVGYYQNTEYDNPEWNEKPPEGPIQVERLARSLAEKPRVTRFSIKWDTEAAVVLTQPTNGFAAPPSFGTLYSSQSADHSSTFSPPSAQNPLQQPGAPVPLAGSF
ncbi:anti-silence-domain-containing protein [Dacryopinax primogenitus]|uniref:Anti-silencing function protein 1 n=1 Tax=Dacryopinax primogenitus (strain DJM 731) TaxID=1858805 RepID=M5G980_DACPD|nr:anti-silence-domain-containing protein [Dacryopinax primogenitus]EJU00348.1 anti-silence-domain-containing protein [Dacryopinax primogenitus]